MYHLFYDKDTDRFFIMRFIKNGYEFTWLKSPNPPYEFIRSTGHGFSRSLDEFVYDYAHPEDPDASFQLNYSYERLEDIQLYFNNHPELLI